eukprot:1030158-Rhodomonas_salina.1
MRGHPESGAVQSTGCYTLWALALNDVAKKTILGVGGIEAVVEAMQGHLESAAVQASGCGALCNLDNSSATKSCIKIVSLGGLDVVVKAMRSHSKSETVQKLGCIALKNAAFNPDNKMKIAAVHGVEAVVEAMQGHPKSEVVQKAGCQALRKLAANADNQIKIAGVGGMEALVEAVRNHLESAEVQKVGFQVLRTLASNNNNKIKIAGGHATTVQCCIGQGDQYFQAQGLRGMRATRGEQSGCTWEGPEDHERKGIIAVTSQSSHCQVPSADTATGRTSCDLRITGLISEQVDNWIKRTSPCPMPCCTFISSGRRLLERNVLGDVSHPARVLEGAEVWDVERNVDQACIEMHVRVSHSDPLGEESSGFKTKKGKTGTQIRAS